MASPDSNHYHNTHLPHPSHLPIYNHHDPHPHPQPPPHQQPLPQQQQQHPASLPSAGDRGGMYPEHPHPHSQLPAQPLPQPLRSHMELDQPLDLSVSRSPRPASVGSYEVPAAKRPHLETPRDSTMGREAHSSTSSSSSMCLIRGCSCLHSSSHHSSGHHSSGHHQYPQQHHHQAVAQHHHHYKQHRHSPYPQYSPGHASPAAGVREAEGYPQHPSYHPPPLPPQSSSSPSVLYGLGPASPYISPPLPSDQGRASPAARLSGDLLRQGASPGAFLCPPPHSSASPMAISPHPRDPSPHTPPQALARARDQDVSPRPFYRPFEVDSRPEAVHHPSAAVSSMVDPSYPSDADLSASSSLLMLSNPPAPSAPPAQRSLASIPSFSSSSSSVSASSSSSSILTMADSSLRDYVPQLQEAVVEEVDPRCLEPTQSDAEDRVKTYHELTTPAKPLQASRAGAGNTTMSQVQAQADSATYSRHSAHKASKALGPAQDGTVASSLPSSEDLRDSPVSRLDKRTKVQEKDLFKVVGSNKLLELREEQARRKAKITAERMKGLLVQRNDYHGDSNDSEGVSDVNSSGQPSPKSNDGSDQEVGQGFPIPPDPNLKMSALDYLISKVLVEHRDIPFRACNTEIREIYSGAKKGPFTLVNLIELQVEASLKA